ncbi:MAG: response regulator [Planctomycetales bacterium]|nr:response regulator [Planctomycetales bacterium]
MLLDSITTLLQRYEHGHEISLDEACLMLRQAQVALIKAQERSHQLEHSRVASLAHAAELHDTRQWLASLRQDVDSFREETELLSAFGDILDRSLNEIYIFDANSLNFLHVNHGAQTNIGYSMEELRRMRPVDIKPDHTFETFAKLVQPLLDGSSRIIQFETVHRRKDGSTYPVQVKLERSVLGKRSVFIAVILDITERNKFDRELRRSREIAIAADRSKSEFLANMSHEIRTPMTAILGYGDILTDATASDADRHAASVAIQRNGKHLLELINEILDLSKIEAGKLTIERRVTPIMNLVEDVRELLADRAVQRGNELLIEVKGRVPTTVVTDSTRLKQALVNLVGNAIKFTKDGTVSVTLSCDAARERMKIAIADTGIGIAEDQLSKVFAPFSQADSSTTRNYGGTGLGLTITKRISELLGGDLSVDSKVGAGSVFSIEFSTGSLDQAIWADRWSVRRTARATASASTPKSHRLAGRFLVVEDGLDNQRLIKLVLEKLDAEVTVVENGKEGVDAALEAVRTGRPYDIILMDMQMPVMDGYTATAHLRQQGYERPIIALTAHAMHGEANRCLKAGCDAYLSKPINRTQFYDELSRWLSDSDDATEPATRTGTPADALN